MQGAGDEDSDPESWDFNPNMVSLSALSISLLIASFVEEVVSPAYKGIKKRDFNNNDN